jgi:hypothetical protein
MYIAGSDIEISLALKTKTGAVYDLTGLTVVMNWERPSRGWGVRAVKGQWAATILSPGAGTIQAWMPHEENTVAGTWKIWATTTIAGRQVKFAATRITVADEGTKEV